MQQLITTAMDHIFSVFEENEPVLLVRPDAENIPLRGIFSETTQDITNGGVIVTSTSPNLTVWRDDLPSLRTNFRFVIRGEIFSVKDYLLDGHGNITLELFRE